MGEEDEVSIQEAAEAVVEAMDFHGDVTVSFGSQWHRGPSCTGTAGLTHPVALTLAAGGAGGDICCSLPEAPLGKAEEVQGQAGGAAASSAMALTGHPV